MSVARPARCLLSKRFAAALKPAAPTCNAAFHSSARVEARKKQRFQSIRAEEMGLTSPEKVQKYTEDNFQPYTPEEIEVLKKHYSPEQMEALEAGEAAIDPKDLTIQGRLRRDPYQIPYLDDFSRLAPVVDKRPKKHIAPDFTKIRWLSENEFINDIQKFAKEVDAPQAKTWMEGKLNDPTLSEEQKEWVKGQLAKITAQADRAKSLDGKHGDAEGLDLLFERSMLNDDNAPSDTSLAPSLGKDIPGISGIYQNPIDPEDQGLDDEGIYQDLKRRTGLSVREMMDLTVKILVVRMVHNQTRLGKIRSVWVMAIAGNGNGRLGIGEAKSVENGAAVQKAKLLAIRNMKPVPRYEERTIFGSVTAKFGGTIVKLDARPPGFGLRVSARFFEMFRACGIHDIAAKMPRSRRPMNAVKACFEALTNQKDPNEIAIGRGKKLVDVRKVYFGGNVL
ncbi:37S ribosomal protein S5 [Apiospora saccharicola]|uniref:37S ribosomal protein S5 n=1 Tax=Apiospora saccharicola TaxID=335842 RepID=A0ABR1W4J9_9PEZI